MIPVDFIHVLVVSFTPRVNLDSQWWSNIQIHYILYNSSFIPGSSVLWPFPNDAMVGDLSSGTIRCVSPLRHVNTRVVNRCISCDAVIRRCVPLIRHLMLFLSAVATAKRQHKHPNKRHPFQTHNHFFFLSWQQHHSESSFFGSATCHCLSLK